MLSLVSISNYSLSLLIVALCFLSISYRELSITDVSWVLSYSFTLRMKFLFCYKVLDDVSFDKYSPPLNPSDNWPPLNSSDNWPPLNPSDYSPPINPSDYRVDELNSSITWINFPIISSFLVIIYLYSLFYSINSCYFKSYSLTIVFNWL